MTTRKKQIKGNNSTERRVEQFQEANKIVDVPEGLTLDSDEAKLLWKQFTSTRGASDWRVFDLCMIHKMVLLEILIRKENAMIETEGAVIENLKGTTNIENPRLRAVDTLQRQQLTFSRAMSLSQTSVAPLTLNNRGKENQDAKNKTSDDTDSLINMPTH